MIVIDGNTYLDEKQADKLRVALGRVEQGKKVFASWVVNSVLSTQSKEQIDSALDGTNFKVNWSKINIR